MAVVLGTVACDDVEESRPLSASSDLSSILATGSYSLNSNDYVSIAEMHNQVLSQSIEDIDWNSSNHTNEIRNYYSALVDSDFGISPDSFQSLLGNINNLESETFALISDKTDFQSIYNSIITIGNSTSDYSQVLTDLDALKSTANNSLIGDDLEAALLMIETSKKSANFWLPISRDGSGVGSDFLDDYWEDNDLPGAPNIGKAMAIDGLGASHYFLMIGLLLVPTPLSLGAIIVAVGTYSAYASLAYVISAM